MNRSLKWAIKPEQRWTDYLSVLPWQPGQLDEIRYRAFLRAGFGIPAGRSEHAKSNANCAEPMRNK